MNDTSISNVTRNLPTALTGEVERLGYSVLRALDRLGFVHETRDGGLFSIRFDAVRLYGSTWAAYHVDAERLYHFSVSDLAKPAVLAQLSAVTHKPVRTLDDGGLAYVVELAPKPVTRLPDRVMLDLSARPSGLGTLAVPLGVGRDGAAWRNLPDLGHTLIVGTTGSGKSTWLHSALAALLTSATRAQLRLALIDPKRSEFTAWAGVPHLLSGIANTTEQATALLSDLAQEVDQRGEMFGAVLCRDLAAYNRKAVDPLPYILIAIDECLDLVLSAGKKSELAGYLKTIAIRGRSAGVILWAATQHAAAITGLPRVVNVNLTARLVFRVSDQSAALAAGCPGAETLPRDKPGRLLANPGGDPRVMQAFYLTDDALLAVTRGLSSGSVTATGKHETITPEQAALVHAALDRLDGAFIVNKLAAICPGWTSHRVKTLAQRWAREKLLTVPGGGNDPRRVTPELAEMAQAASGVMVEFTSPQGGVRQSADAEAVALNSEYSAA